MKRSVTKKIQRGVITGNMVLSLLEKYLACNQEISGYIRFNCIVVKTLNQEIKIKIFFEQKKILSYINERLDEMGFTQTFNKILCK